MKLTQEQLEIINSTGNIKINAVAGSGKTSTIIEYAKTRPKNSKILYLAFNKSVKLEAIKKFNDINVSNVTVDTIHALAYKNIVFKNRYKLKQNGYNTDELVKLLKLDNVCEKYEKYILANHINKFFVYFCNSDKEKISDLNYFNIISDDEAKDFVKKYYKIIENGVISLFKKMNNREIEITHDFYLKEYQLSNPKFIYDYIIFDEGQDASAVILDIFLKQRGIKVIVGDTHQQIYSWRHAINALEKTDFKTYFLTTSFRFHQSIADLALRILKWKNYIGKDNYFKIIGAGNSKLLKTKAILARTNLHLLMKAIEHISQTGKIKSLFNFIYKNFLKKEIRNIYFEGNINSCIYALEGVSIYDVLNLLKGKHKYIKNTIIGNMKDITELLDYVKKTENKELPIMIDIVKKYGDKTPLLIKKLKNMIINDDDKNKAKIIFSTVHKSKGMEYDIVELADDFITEKKLEKIRPEFKINDIELAGLNEEINLLYVAITRAKNTLIIPGKLMPKDFQCSNQIIVKKEKKKKKSTKQARS